ncbi:hypothetical protein [Hymenobacter arizonensis]|nr:hypothetical protein [Hymenobacter arizonensis]
MFLLCIAGLTGLAWKQTETDGQRLLLVLAAAGAAAYMTYRIATH